MKKVSAKMIKKGLYRAKSDNFPFRKMPKGITPNLDDVDLDANILRVIHALPNFNQKSSLMVQVAIDHGKCHHREDLKKPEHETAKLVHFDFAF